MNKRTVQVQANSLHDADVRFISLVKRGANKVPVRILKSETLPEDRKMGINLSGMTKIFSKKSQARQDVLAGITVQKGDNADRIVENIGHLGFKTEVEDHGEFLLLKQDEMTAEEELVPVNYGNGVIGLIRTQKSFMPGSASDDFRDNLATESFFPSVGMALETFFSTTREIMFSSSTPDEAATKIAQAADDFREFTVTMASSLPENAFLLEKAATAPTDEESASDETATSDEEEPEGVEKTDGDDGNHGAPATSDEEGGESVEKSEGSASDETATQEDEMNDEIRTLVTQMQESIQKSIGELSTSMADGLGDLAKRVEAVEKSNGELAVELESTKATAEGAQKAVKSVVASESQEEDGTRLNGSGRRVEKSDEDDVWQGVLDFPGMSGGSQ